MENITKIQVAISLFSGAILALAVFFGTIGGNFLSDIMKKYPKISFWIGLISFLAFVILMYLIIRFSLQVLFNPSSTDFHSFRDILKKIVR